MDVKQRHALLLRETDIDGAIRRCNDDEELYISCLIMFLEDSTMNQLNDAIKNTSWDDAFTAAHALKGLAGNMGFVPLMHATGQLIIMIRGGRIRDAIEYLPQVNSCYRSITEAISEYFAKDSAGGEKR